MKKDRKDSLPPFNQALADEVQEMLQHPLSFEEAQAQVYRQHGITDTPENPDERGGVS